MHFLKPNEKIKYSSYCTTQSLTLIDQFKIDDIIVADRKNGQFTFERLKEESFNVWLENYQLGELWIKNVIEGGQAMSDFANIVKSIC